MDELPILYQDDVVVAIDKPAGLLVHRTSLDSQATEFALQRLRDQIAAHVYPVHRLDRPTSGVLLFGLHPEAARDLTMQFADRAVEKTYTAFVRGFCDDCGSYDRPLRDKVDPRSTTRLQGAERDAVTEFRTLDRFEVPFSDGRHATSRYSLLRLVPRTGRRHQIRRHLKHASHPILGDTEHGDHRHNQRFRETFGLTRMLLVATSLGFTHPRTGRKLVLNAPLGREFEELLRTIR